MLQHEDHEEFARCVGLARYYRCRMDGTIDRTINPDADTPEKRKRNDIWGARCELIVALETGLPWTGIDRGAIADVGNNIEVKSTVYGKGHLIVRPHFHWESTGISRQNFKQYSYDEMMTLVPKSIAYINSHIYAFVVQDRRQNTVNIIGYIHGSKTMTPEYWSNSIAGDSWWIPQSDLTRNYGDLV